MAGSCAVDPFVEVPHNTRGDAPNVAISEGYRVIIADDPFPVAAAALVVGRIHQKSERHFERLGDLARIDDERKIRLDASHRRQNPKSGKGQIEIEITEWFDQGRRQPDLLLGLA